MQAKDSDPLSNLLDDPAQERQRVEPGFLGKSGVKRDAVLVPCFQIKPHAVP